MAKVISDEALAKLLNERGKGKLPTAEDPRVNVELDDYKVRGGGIVRRGKKVESFYFYPWLRAQLRIGRKRPYSKDLIEALAKHGYEPEEFFHGWRLRVAGSERGRDHDQTGNSHSREEESSRTPMAEKMPTGSPGQLGLADARLNPEYGYWVGADAQGHAMTHDQESVPWDVPDFEEGAQKFAEDFPNWQEFLYGATAQDYLPQVPPQGFNEMPVSFGNQAVPAVLPGPAYDVSYPVGPGIQGGPAQPYGNFDQAATDMGYGQSSQPHNPVDGHAVLTQPPLGPAGQFGTHGTDRHTTNRGWTGQQWQVPSQGQMPSQGKAPTR
ncbi:hypothetical protein ACWD5R_19620 [Streptomyces sp. NPDC002514]|uniref:hypothetical protein n=1 Tax=Streptomyces sp. NPDC001270 TaxID=3364554 RepID=UPI0036BBC7A2